MMLETVRGCRFRCKYCYYPKGNHRPRTLSAPQILANLEHALRHRATEVVLLDPTLDGRPDFAGFLRLLGRGNETGRLKLSGELRAEGIGSEEARLLRKAGFHEVEVGLQSVEPKTWTRMGRPTDLDHFRRGVRALLDEGIKVCVDLMLGLPGETADSARRAVDFLLDGHLYSTVQVFNLSILPGTAFRRQAEALGLRYQPWPPYYVVATPTLTAADLCQLMAEAEEALGVEFDPLPPPWLDSSDVVNGPATARVIELDAGEGVGDGDRGPVSAGWVGRNGLGHYPPSPPAPLPQAGEGGRLRELLAPGCRDCATRFGSVRPIFSDKSKKRPDKSAGYLLKTRLPRCR